MADERSGGGNPERTLRLLWRDSLSAAADGRRGPRRRLNVDAVIDAAIALCDAEGLSALTMRSLADRLSVKAMTLYTYVPGRAELIDLMLDRVYLTMERPAFDEELSWRERVRQVADRNRLLFQRNPWAAVVSTARPPLGPGQMAKYDYELAAFTGSGLDDLQIDDALTLVLTFVRANARDADAARAAQEASGTDDRGWWEQAGPLFAQVFDEHHYPLAARIGTAAGSRRGSAHDPGHAYDFGLDCILDALEQRASADGGLRS